MLNINFLILLNFLNLNNPTQTFETTKIEYKAPAKAASSNNFLSTVEFKDISFKFDKENTKYTIEVPYSKDKLDLTYTQEDKTSIVEVVGDDFLQVGNNSLAILVTAEDGSLREYDFSIIRSEDNTIVQSDPNSIKDVLTSSDSKKLTVNMSTDNLLLDSKTIDTLKESKKTLVFRWTDYNNKFLSSLSIDGSKIESSSEIIPKIKNTISNNKLKDYLKDIEYTSLSTKNTNIPNNSIYKMAVTTTEDLYYLFYYEDDLLIQKPLRVIDNAIEFEIQDGIDYAITTKSNKPKSKESSIGGTHWLWISIFITVLFIVFFAITKYTALKYVQHSHHKDQK